MATREIRLVSYTFSKIERGIKSIEGMNTISSESRKIKMEQIVPIYASQIGAKKAFDHMFDYENFVFNKDWDPKF